MFKPFQIPYQLPISDLPQVIAANKIRETNTFMHWCIFLLQFCLKWLDKYFFRRTLAFFCSQSTSPATWSWGGFWNVNGYFSSGWSCIYPKGHCFDLDEGRQRKSLKRQQVITYCVVASVQVPVIALPIKNENKRSSFSLMDSEVILAIWKRLVSQSVQSLTKRYRSQIWWRT